MINLSKRGQSFIFSVNGGDSQTSFIALYSPIVGLLIPIAVYGFSLQRYVSDSWRFIGWIVIALFAVFVLSRVFRSLYVGRYSRFEVQIDPEYATISVYDRIEHILLWQDEFIPRQLYISKIEVSLRGDTYKYPALVYGVNQLDVVHEGVPYPDMSLLGYGTEPEIKSTKDIIIKSFNTYAGVSQ